MSDSPHVAFRVKLNQAMVRVESGSAQEQTWPVWPSDQFSAKGGHQRRFTICQALASLQGRISQGWDKSKCPCNCVIGIAVKRSLPHSSKLHTKRQRQLSILHFLDVLASGNSYRATRPHGTEACGLYFQSVHQLGFRYAWFDASAEQRLAEQPDQGLSRLVHRLLPVPSQNLTHGRNRGGCCPMSGWHHQASSSEWMKF